MNHSDSKIKLMKEAPIQQALLQSGIPTMIEIGSKGLRANGVTFALFGVQMVYSSTFLALGRGREGSILSISRQGIFFIPVILLLPVLLNADGYDICAADC